MESLSRPSLFDFYGVCMTKYFTDNWDNIQNFKAGPDDIVLASYPKAGNTWVSYILDLLYFGQTSPERQGSVPLHERVPFLEIQIPGFPSGVDALNELSTFPRIIKTHLPAQFLPKSFWEQNSKIIYVARNAKDTAVSYFHFDRMNKAQPEPGNWENFLQRFMEGKMVFGSWYEHVRGWWEKKQISSNILYLFYEDLIEDFEQELGRICSFLGLSPTTELKKQVTEKVLFDNMKTNKMVNGSTDEVFDFKISPFMRKGRVGDWKNHFTVQQDEQFNEDYEKKMKNTDLLFRTVLYAHLDGDPKEVSPVIDQFLECVWQLSEQFPCAFEFNERFLIAIHTHVYSCQYGTFLGNSQKERRDMRLRERSHTVWPQLWKDRAEYTNPLYMAELSQSQGILRPNTSPYCFKIWKGLYNHAEKSTPPRQSTADFLSAVREESQQLEEELTNHQERIAALTGKPVAWEKIEVPRRRISRLQQRHSGPDPPTTYTEPITSPAQDNSHTLSSVPANQKAHTKDPAFTLALGPHSQLKSHDPDDLSTCSDLESGVADLSSRSSSGGDDGKDPDLE